MVSFFSFGNKFKFNLNTNKVVISNNSLLNTNSAAIGSSAFWNGGLNFNSVGTNGKSSSYGTFDQTGLAWEWCDANSTSNTYKVIRGGDISNTGGIANYYNSDKSKRYLKTTTGGDTNPVSFVTSPNRNKGKPQDQDWSGRIVSISNPLSLNNYVTIGNTNNSSDTNGYGSVSYSYQISKYLLTNDEYCAFLNLKAVSDPNQLYATQMSTERVGGIVRSGVSGSYSYSVKTNMGNKPVYFLSWFSLARYCNWLHNGMGSGSTETGAYTLNNALTGIINKNVGANYYIPNENEWYKAAYYKGGSSNAGYWKFATQSDSIPQIVASTLNGDGTIRNVSIKPVNTIGSNVSVTGINDSIYNVGISINYAQISSSGVTKVTPVTLNDPKLPVNFSLSNSLGKYNISTTSSRSGNIDICFTLPSTISLSTFNKTKVFHTSSGITTDVTITTGANAPNFSNKTICARVSNFSDFHIIPENDNFNYAIPSNVSGSVSNGSVNLNWNMSDTTDIFDYSIKYSSDSGNSWSEYNHLPNSGLSLVVDGLTNNTSYLFSVAAIGLSGIGNYSSYSSSLTPVASVPDIVTGLSGAPNINSVDLVWNVPNNNGSNIINYSVQYSSNSGSTWISSNDPLYLFADDVSTTRNLTVTNLNSSNSYIFRISAINSIGSGNYSSYSNSIIPLDNIPVTPTPTPTITATVTPTNSITPTPTVTPTNSITPTPTNTVTPSSSSPPANNGIIIQSNVSSTPRALVGGGATYNPTFINTDYRAYFGNIVNQWNRTLVSGSLPYNTTSANNYYFYNGLPGRGASGFCVFNFIVPTVVTKYRLWNGFNSNTNTRPYNNNTAKYASIANQTPTSWKLQGTNDGFTWVDVDIRTSQPRLPYATSSDPTNSPYSEFAVISPTAYKAYQFVVTGFGRDGYSCGKGGCYYDWQLGELQLWGYESPQTSCALHGYKYTLPTARYINSSGVEVNDIFNLALFGVFGAGGDSRPSASDRPVGNGYPTPSNWVVNFKINDTPLGQYITKYIQFDIPIVLNSCSFRCNILGSGSISSWDIYGSNDLTSWTLLDSRSNQTNYTYATKFNFSNTMPYKYYKFIFKDGLRNNYKSGVFWSAGINDIMLSGTLI